jgi:hypothetical protein
LPIWHIKSLPNKSSKTVTKAKFSVMTQSWEVLKKPWNKADIQTVGNIFKNGKSLAWRQAEKLSPPF